MGIMGLLALCLLGCRPGQTQWEPVGEAPAAVLDRETMISVLTAMHLAEGDALERAMAPERSDSLLASHYARIARDYNTNLETIHESYLWYVERPLTLKPMYDEVVERLNRLQGSWQSDPSSPGLAPMEGDDIPADLPKAQPAQPVP
jgi:hypothetical protein